MPNCNLHVSLSVVLIETEKSGSHFSFRTTKKPLENNIYVVFVSHRKKNTAL